MRLVESMSTFCHLIVILWITVDQCHALFMYRKSKIPHVNIDNKGHTFSMANRMIWFRNGLMRSISFDIFPVYNWSQNVLFHNHAIAYFMIMVVREFRQWIYRLLFYLQNMGLTSRNHKIYLYYWGGLHVVINSARIRRVSRVLSLIR